MSVKTDFRSATVPQKLQEFSGNVAGFETKKNKTKHKLVHWFLIGFLNQSSTFFDVLFSPHKYPSYDFLRKEK